MNSENKFGHIMVDIETMGNKSNSAIVSIGAVEFNIATGETGREFYVNVSLQSCIDMGLTINADTIMWWMRQDDDARKALMCDTIDISSALHEFTVFVNDCGNKSEIWGNSNRFDLGILEDAYTKNFTKVPWDFRKERDVRTLVSFRPVIKDMTKPIGIAHNAVHDCYFQIRYCSDIYKNINNIE